MHKGEDAGKVHHIELADGFPYHNARQTCFVNEMLDGTSQVRVECQMELRRGDRAECNGNPSFCNLRYV